MKKIRLADILLCFAPMVILWAVQLTVKEIVYLAVGALADMTMVVMCIYMVISFAIEYFMYFKWQKKKLNTIKGNMNELSLVSIVLIFTSLVVLVNSVMAVAIVLLPSSAERYYQLMDALGANEMRFATVIVTIFFAPIVEELAFRGLTMHFLSKLTDKFILINILQAALFGLFHLNVIQGIYAFIVALALGYVVHKYRSVGAGIFAHAVFNLTGTYGISLFAKLPLENPMVFLLLRTVTLLMLLAGYAIMAAQTRKTKKAE